MAPKLTQKGQKWAYFCQKPNMATFAMKIVAIFQKISWPRQSEIWPHWPFMATVGNTAAELVFSFRNRSLFQKRSHFSKEFSFGNNAHAFLFCFDYVTCTTQFYLPSARTNLNKNPKSEKFWHFSKFFSGTDLEFVVFVLFL